MDEQFSYDYGELAFDLYQAADELLDDLVAMRKHRGMTQSQLADEMGVSQSYISQIENGQKQLVSLLTDYAQEVGARIKYVVEPAERRPKKVIGVTSLDESRCLSSNKSACRHQLI